MEEQTLQHRRAKVSWPVTIYTEEGIIERITYNISPNGAFIRGLSPLELHEVVDMTLGGPDRSITVKARVVWSSSQVPPDKDMPRGMGVKFVNWFTACLIVTLCRPQNQKLTFICKCLFITRFIVSPPVAPTANIKRAGSLLTLLL